MALNKQGVFFTFTALIFLSLLIFSSSLLNTYEMREKHFVIETRINTINNFLSDVEQDIQRAAYISGFRALLEITNHLATTGTYLSNVNQSFNELFLNGTLNNTNSSLMANNTFPDWIEKIKNESEKVDILVNFSINTVSISQDNPWSVRVDLNLELDLSDKESFSRWHKQKSLSSHIEIDGFEDPTYLIGTNGLVGNRFQRTNFTYFTNGADISNLLNHTYEGYYIEFTDAPSYLMRLAGNFNSSAYGIESLVDLDELNSKGVSVKDKSIVDYIYFRNNNPQAYHVQGAPSWFKLDNRSNTEGNQTHLELYQVTNLIS